jgi:dTDP-glucose pyrophosphorylase
MKPTLLVLAAGMGSRYGGLKQIDPIGPNGEIIIDYSVYDAIRAGFGKVVFVIRRDIETEFKAVVGSRFAGVIEVDYVYQDLDALPAGFSVPEGRVKPWGTAHAILMAKDIIDGPFAVINADDFYGAAGFKVMADHLAQAKDGEWADYCMVGYVLRNTLSEHGTVSRGICRADDDGFLVDVVERTRIRKTGNTAFDEADEVALTGDEPVSMNLFGFTPSFFDHLDVGFREFLTVQGTEMKSEYYIASPITHLIESNQAKVRLLSSTDAWFGVTYPEDKPSVVASVRKLVDAGAYPNDLKAEA